MISVKLQSNFVEIAHPHRYSPVNLLHIFRTPFYKNSFEGLLSFGVKDVLWLTKLFYILALFVNVKVLKKYQNNEILEFIKKGKKIDSKSLRLDTQITEAKKQSSRGVP